MHISHQIYVLNTSNVTVVSRSLGKQDAMLKIMSSLIKSVLTSNHRKILAVKNQVSPSILFSSLWLSRD